MSPSTAFPKGLGWRLPWSDFMNCQSSIKYSRVFSDCALVKYQPRFGIWDHGNIIGLKINSTRISLISQTLMRYHQRVRHGLTFWILFLPQFLVTPFLVVAYITDRDSIQCKLDLFQSFWLKSLLSIVHLWDVALEEIPLTLIKSTVWDLTIECFGNITVHQRPQEFFLREKRVTFLMLRHGVKVQSANRDAVLSDSETLMEQSCLITVPTDSVCVLPSLGILNIRVMLTSFWESHAI